MKSDAGYVPSVHGDEHAHPAPMGCGFFKLWSLGQLPGLDAPDYNSEQGQAKVLGAGGVYETLEGSHSESKVMINLVADKTLEPKADQRFVVDAWVLAYLIQLSHTCCRDRGTISHRVMFQVGPSDCVYVTNPAQWLRVFVSSTSV